VLVVAIVVGGLAAPGWSRSARAAGQGGDEEVYESPQYGYTLAYDPDEWEVFQEDSDPDDEYDQIFLVNGVSLVGITGDPDYDDDEMEDCVEDYAAGLENGESNSDIEPLDEPDAEGDDDDRAWATYSYTFEFDDGTEGDFVSYYECRWLGDGVTVVIYQDVAIEDYEDEIEAREDLLEGLEPAGGGGGNGGNGGSGGGDEEVYESPQYGYTVAYDSEEWEIAFEDEDPDDEYDQVYFFNGVSLVGIIGDPDFDASEEGALSDCVDAYVGGFEDGESNSDVEPLDEPDAEGEDDDRAWATYAYTYTDEDGDEEEYVHYFECRSVGAPTGGGPPGGGPPEGGPPEGGEPPEGGPPEGGPPGGEAPAGVGLTLVIVHDAPAGDYEDEIEARENLLDGLELPEPDLPED
jgi:hypothetical protein